MYDLSAGLNLKKDFCWNCLYRFRKAFGVIASNGFCCQQLSFTLLSFRSDCPSLMYDLRTRLVFKKDFCWNCFTGFANLLRWLRVMAFAANSCLLTFKAFAAIALSSFVYYLSERLDFKKDFWWNCLYRFRKAFAVIASNGFCCEQLSFTL